MRKFKKKIPKKSEKLLESATFKANVKKAEIVHRKGDRKRPKVVVYKNAEEVFCHPLNTRKVIQMFHNV